MTRILERTVAGRAEPVSTITSAVNGAVLATINVVGSPWVLAWPPELLAAVNVAAAAWVTVAAIAVHALRR